MDPTSKKEFQQGKNDDIQSNNTEKYTAAMEGYSFQDGKVVEPAPAEQEANTEESPHQAEQAPNVAEGQIHETNTEMAHAEIENESQIDNHEQYDSKNNLSTLPTDTFNQLIATAEPHMLWSNAKDLIKAGADPNVIAKQASEYWDDIGYDDRAIEAIVNCAQSGADINNIKNIDLLAACADQLIKYIDPDTLAQKVIQADSYDACKALDICLRNGADFNKLDLNNASDSIKITNAEQFLKNNTITPDDLAKLCVQKYFGNWENEDWEEDTESDNDQEENAKYKPRYIDEDDFAACLIDCASAGANLTKFEDIGDILEEHIEQFLHANVDPAFIIKEVGKTTDWDSDGGQYEDGGYYGYSSESAKGINTIRDHFDDFLQMMDPAKFASELSKLKVEVGWSSEDDGCNMYFHYDEYPGRELVWEFTDKLLDAGVNQTTIDRIKSLPVYKVTEDNWGTSELSRVEYWTHDQIQDTVNYWEDGMKEATIRYWKNREKADRANEAAKSIMMNKGLDRFEQIEALERCRRKGADPELIDSYRREISPVFDRHQKKTGDQGE